MKGQKPLTLRIQEAASQSDLPKDARHLIHVMCVYANSKTGEGWHGQETLAKYMGCSDRHVRALLADLSRDDSVPVRVERQARYAGVRGRTSDRWRLVLTAHLPEHHSGKEERINRNDVPAEAPPDGGSTGTPRPIYRNTTTDLPERGSGDPRSEPRSEPRSNSARSTSRPKSGSSSGSSKKAKKASAKAKPKAQPTPVPGAHDLKVHYCAEFEKHRGAKPEFGKRWSRAVKAFGELVTTHGLDKSKTIVSRALSDSYARRIEPWNLVDDAVRWLGAQPQGANKHAVQRSLVAGWKPSTNPDWDSPDSVVTP